MTVAKLGAAMVAIIAAAELSRKCALAIASLLALVLTPAIAAAQEYSDIESNGNLQLRGLGSFFIEGDTKEIDSTTANGAGSFFITLPGGAIMTNQMHVQFMLPKQKSKKRYPIALVHGCCLSSKSWQTTPDGRMGWDEYFVRRGFDTYLMDQVGRARSGFDPTGYNDVRAGVTTDVTDQAPIQIATDQFAWNVFRWGTTPCTASPCAATTTAHPDIKFPMETVGVGPGSNLQFYSMVIPDLHQTLSGHPAPSDPSGFYNTPAQMAKLASKLGGVILVGHSQSSSYPTRAALQTASGCYPWTSAEACNVKGIIQLETGCFSNLTQGHIDTLKHIPILVVAGDYYTTPRPPDSCVTMMDQINGAGGDMKFAHLPALVPGDFFPGSPGPLPGVEHMMMVGTKNIEVADLLIGWIDYHVKVGHRHHKKHKHHWGHWKH